MFFNCLEQLRHGAHDVSPKEEGKADGKDGPVVNEIERSRPSRSEKRFQKARPKRGEQDQRHRRKTACDGKDARRFSLSLDGKEQRQRQPREDKQIYKEPEMSIIEVSASFSLLLTAYQSAFMIGVDNYIIFMQFRCENSMQLFSIYFLDS